MRIGYKAGWSPDSGRLLVRNGKFCTEVTITRASSITNEANLIGGEIVGGSESQAVHSVAASDDDDGDGESDPDRRKRKQRQVIPSAVANFDSLPDSAKLDLACLKALTAKSRATIYRWIDQGILPKPHKFGASRNFWNVGDIRRALSAVGGA